MQDHFNKIEKLIKDLDVVSKRSTDDIDKINFLLLTMPEKFENVITSIKTIMNKNTFVHRSTIKITRHGTERKGNYADTKIVSNNNTYILCTCSEISTVSTVR